MSDESNGVVEAIERTEGLTRVPVDSGTLLVVDPCNLPAGLLEEITSPNEHGVTVAVAVAVGSDGWFRVEATEAYDYGVSEITVSRS